MNREYQKMWEIQKEMLDQWLGLSKKMFQPVKEGKSSRASAKKDTKASTVPPTDWPKAMTEFYQHWMADQEEVAKKWWKAFGELSGAPDPYFSGFGFSKAQEEGGKFWKAWMQNFPGLFPPDTWTSYLNKTHQGFDKYIEFLNEIDLPFDEIAAFWDRMLVRFTPLDEVPLFRLGNDIHHYLEILANPFYAIAGTPKLMRAQKAFRDIQFYYLSFVLKNAELRGKILEASMAVMPETIRPYMEGYETSGTAPSGADFFQLYVDNLDKHLKKLLASDEYSHIQNEVARVGVELKSKMDELMELSVEGLPLLTKSDEDDIAKEIEALRVKVRELSQIQKKELGKKALKEEAMN